MNQVREPSSDSASIREQEISALKFRSTNVDVLENNRRIEVVTDAEARRRLRLGGYEPVGNTVKYIRRLPIVGGPVDGPVRKAVPRASDNFTIDKARGHQFSRRFLPDRHPWPGSARHKNIRSSRENEKSRFSPQKSGLGQLQNK